MNRAWRFAVLLVVVAAVAAGSCFLTGRWMAARRPPAINPDAGNAHEWIHRELALTAEQDRALEPVESRYAARRDAVTDAIRQANAELARAIREDRADSPRVAAAVDKIHRAQGELQKVTLEHVFEMGQALTPAQRNRLVELTANALEADGR